MPGEGSWRSAPTLLYSRAMDLDGKEAIEATNAEFYLAIEAGSIGRMDEVWAHEDWIGCVHPGWNLICGWDGVRQSWLRIFEGGQRMRISPTDVVTSIVGELAWVTCVENITVFVDDSFDSVQAIATNLFMRRASGWLLVHHHASPTTAIVPDQSSDVIQ